MRLYMSAVLLSVACAPACAQSVESIRVIDERGPAYCVKAPAAHTEHDADRLLTEYFRRGRLAGIGMLRIERGSFGKPPCRPDEFLARSQK